MTAFTCTTPPPPTTSYPDMTVYLFQLKKKSDTIVEIHVTAHDIT